MNPIASYMRGGINLKPIIEHWQPQNRITCPMEGDPLYVSTGIIKAVMKTGDKVSVGEIAYQEYEEENFQYRISPYWDIIDGLPENVFHGIPGIDLDLRLKHYYRVNYIPTFIAERTPSKNREDLWELLESVGLDYYDRFEWLLRTDMRCANDNLIVEPKRKERMENSFSEEKLGELQYGDCLKIHALEDLGSTAHKLSNHLYQLLIRGVDLRFINGDVMIDCNTRTPMVSVAVTKRLLEYQEHMASRKKESIGRK